MINNEKQYRITNSWVKKFEKSLEALHEEQKNFPDVRPKMQQAHIDATQSYIEELRAQLQEYDDLREGRVAVRELSVVEEVPRACLRPHRIGHDAESIVRGTWPQNTIDPAL